MGRSPSRCGLTQAALRTQLQSEHCRCQHLLYIDVAPQLARPATGAGTSSYSTPDVSVLYRSPTCLVNKCLPLCNAVCYAAAVFLDVNQNGKLLTPAACISRYPQLQSILYSQHTQQHPAADTSSQVGWLPPDDAPQHSQPVQNHAVLQPPSAVTVWASLARSMVTAHQRRGESDFVAHWLFQLLALDTQAVEWGHVLKP